MQLGCIHTKSDAVVKVSDESCCCSWTMGSNMENEWEMQCFRCRVGFCVNAALLPRHLRKAGQRTPASQSLSLPTVAIYTTLFYVLCPQLELFLHIQNPLTCFNNVHAGFVCREACECPPGAAPLVVQSSLALMQIQPDQLQDQPVALSDQLLWKLDSPNPKQRDWSPL